METNSPQDGARRYPDQSHLPDQPADENPYGVPSQSVSAAYAPTPGDKQNLADPVSRIVAHMIDQGLPWVVLIFISIVLGTIQYFAGEKEAYGSVAAGVWMAFVLAYIIYQMVLLSRHGQSLGKRILGIKVVRLNGEPADLMRIIFLRNFVPNSLGVITCYIFAIADTFSLFSADHRTLHDRIAETKVVRTVKR